MQSIGPYEGLVEISQSLGNASGSTVYRALEKASGRAVALKVFTPRPSSDIGSSPDLEAISIRAFAREASILANLKHENIVKVLAKPEIIVGQAPYYYVMELLNGETLSKRLNRNQGKLEPHKFAPIFAQIAKALAYIHENGLVHRDIKPNNIYISKDDIVTLIDFGISRYCDKDEHPGRSGTLAYASPEQVLGTEYSTQSDIFSLAALTYEVLAGTPPFTAGSISAMTDKLLSGREKPLHLMSNEIPMALSVCIARALSKAPKHRYNDIESFAKDFGQAIKSGTTHK